MKAFMVTGPRQAELAELKLPKLGPNEILIKVAAAGLCGTDCHIYAGDYFSAYPIIPGHEFAGAVWAIGADVTRFKVGQRVTADPNIFCESCYFCQQNLQNHCENFNATGVTVNGAFAGFVKVPEATVFDIGEIDFQQAAMIEPLACVIYGQERARPVVGQEVLIFGAGPIGLLHLQLAKHNGAAAVTVVDLNPDRLELAKKLGASRVLQAGPDLTKKLAETNSRGFELVIDSTGVPQVVEAAINYVRNNGRLLLFGVCPNNSKVAFNPYEIFHRDLTIIGSFALRKTFLPSIQLIGNKVIDLTQLVSEVIPLSELQNAIERMTKHETKMKVIVIPNE